MPRFLYRYIVNHRFLWRLWYYGTFIWTYTLIHVWVISVGFAPLLLCLGECSYEKTPANLWNPSFGNRKKPTETILQHILVGKRFHASFLRASIGSQSWIWKLLPKLVWIGHTISASKVPHMGTVFKIHEFQAVAPNIPRCFWKCAANEVDRNHTRDA